MLRRNIVLRRAHNPTHSRRVRAGFTLIEMLIAMAITLVMIGAVVTLFANISNSVRNRRAVIEMSGQLRHARNMLQQDLQGATCNGLVWQRPDENQGYIEIIEGPHREGQASDLVDGDPSTSPPRNWPPTALNPEIDHTTSIIPASNLPFTKDAGKDRWVTDGGSLGDYDDILMLTVRNEHEPFVGRAPKTDRSTGAVRQNNSSATLFANWQPTTIESPLAEVVWFAVENPDEDTNKAAGTFFGEAGMRTIYRRALLIAPWFNPYRYTDSNGNIDDTFTFDGADFTAQPGLVRILRDTVNRDDEQQAIAALIAFQERYDLSVRLEWDPLMGSDGRWKIVANTLGDLTKRENRYEHYFYRPVASGLLSIGRQYPFAAASIGSGYGGKKLAFVLDPELTTSTPAAGNANLSSDTAANISGFVANYSLQNPNDPNGPYPARPFVYVNEGSTTLATARAMLNDDGKVIRVIHGLAPLSGDRKGEDVMLSDALAFDLRVYDPAAPLFAHAATETILEPTDPAWWHAYESADNMDAVDKQLARNKIGNGTTLYPFVGQGAYVDLGYGFIGIRPNYHQMPQPEFAPAYSSAAAPWFFDARALSDVYGDQLAPGYQVFDTWSFHYENNGLNEDRLRLNGSSWQEVDTLTDEGTNGLDDVGSYSDGFTASLTNPRLGPDDVGERETVPPYDKPLRGVQVLLRLYERDSRQVRQVSVNQSFVPE